MKLWLHCLGLLRDSCRVPRGGLSVSCVLGAGVFRGGGGYMRASGYSWRKQLERLPVSQDRLRTAVVASDIILEGQPRCDL